MKLSNKDLFRKRIIRFLILGYALLNIIVGSKDIAYNGFNWKGASLGLWGLILVWFVYQGYEYLLKEKEKA